MHDNVVDSYVRTIDTAQLPSLEEALEEPVAVGCSERSERSLRRAPQPGSSQGWGAWQVPSAHKIPSSHSLLDSQDWPSASLGVHM